MAAGFPTERAACRDQRNARLRPHGYAIAPLPALVPALEWHASPLPGISIKKLLLIAPVTGSLLRGLRLTGGLPTTPPLLSISSTVASLIAVPIGDQLDGDLREPASRISVLGFWAFVVTIPVPPKGDLGLLSSSVVVVAVVVSAFATALKVGEIVWIYLLLTKKSSIRAHSAAISVIAPRTVAVLILYAPGLSNVAASIDRIVGSASSTRIGRSHQRLRELEGLQIVIGQGLALKARLRSTAQPYVNSVTAIPLRTGMAGAVLLVLYFAYLLAGRSGQRRLIILVYIVFSATQVRPPINRLCRGPATGSMLYSDRSVLWLVFALTAISGSVLREADSRQASHQIEVNSCLKIVAS